MSTTRSILDWPFFDDATASWRRELDAWAARATARRRPRHGCRRRSAARLVRAAGRGRLAAPRGGRRGARRRERSDRHARDLPAARDAGLPRRPGRFRLRHAGPGHGRDHAGRHAGSSAHASCRAWRAARRSRPSRCPSPTPAPTSRRCSCSARATATHYVLDGEKTWISNGGIADFYVRVRAHRRGAGRARHLGLHRRCRHAGLRRRRAHRRDRAAPAGAAALRRLPRAAQPAASARRARASRSRCARSTCSAPRWRPPRWASRGARWTRRLRAPRRARCSAQRLADFQLTQAKLAEMATTIEAPRC